MEKNPDFGYIDLHCDTVTMMSYPKETLESNKRMVSIPDMKQGGTLVQCFAAFVPGELIPRPFRDKLAWKQFLKVAKKKNDLLALHSEDLLPVLTVEDIESCRREHKIGFLFTIEDAGLFGNDLEKVSRSYAAGVRIASLTWNFENTLAYPQSKKPEVMAKGLKDFGREVVAEMNRVGMVLDVSHLSDGGFRDVAEICKKPFIATHSNSRAMCAHNRNLTDDMIRVLADQGGVMGLNFGPEFLAEPNEGKKSRIEDMVRQVMHIRNVGGSGVLAMGTDFDGISGDLEIGTPAGMPALYDALAKAGMSGEEIEGMCRNNILRVFRENWK